MALALPVGAQTPARPESMAPLTPAEQARTFQLPPGYRLELVASEPMVVEPVLCAFDANGRMFVAEMRSYVQDADGTGTDAPSSRIVRLTDTDGDGRMDRAVTFADGLVLPRMVLPLDHRVLVMETYDGILWCYRDDDDDGVADGREQLFAYGPSRANLEHQDSALIWGIDNWLYSAMGGKRHRLLPDGSLRSEDIYQEFAQWGLATDDLGRQFFASAGGERPAYGFQQHPRYGKVRVDGDREPGFDEVFPLVALPDVQGGPGRLKADGTLNHFTGCCGQAIYRGDALPGELLGDYFLCEPVGRLVRRARVTVDQGKRVLRNAHPGSEFLRSTDPNFRPIWAQNGPDGCLYFVDMYRGIIQESNWVKEGSYLRPVVLELGLDQNIGRGRIWRLVHESRRPRVHVPMAAMPSAELVQRLAHADGFQRETAQRLLVLRQDREIVPALMELARSGGPALGRVHALWTLAGLGAVELELLIAALADADPRVRITALRIAEEPLARGERTLLPHLRKLAVDPELDVRIQVLQSVRFLRTDAGTDLAIDIMAAHKDNALIQAIGGTTLRHGTPEAEADGRPTLSVPDLLRWRRGREHYRMTCMVCHGPDGLGVPAGNLRLAPPLARSRWLLESDEVVIRILLHGMTGTLDGVDYPGNLMAPQGTNPDTWIADVLTYVRNAFGNAGAPIVAADVGRVRAATRDRRRPYLVSELEPMLPVPPAAMAAWRLSASHGGDSCARAIDGDPKTRFTTGTPMRPGMWLQIDFGAPFQARELTLDCRGSDGDYPRGYQLRTSDDGEQWSEPVATGTGSGPVVIIAPAMPAPARFLRIEQTGAHDGLWWSVHQLKVSGR